MAKDINIHIKTRGSEQTKQQLQGVGRSAEKVGDSTEKMGKDSERGGSKIVGVLKKLAGPIGFMAIATAVAAAAAKVAKFFDGIKQKCDEAVRQVQEIRKAYESLFEAMDAFDEKSRQQVTRTTNLILKDVGVTQELGLPIIDEYTRQFKSLVEAGRITQQQYEQGMKEMLGYAARHGGEATKDLISIMSGWGMVTPEQQGAFRRQIAAGAAEVGLRDEDIIEALGRGMPTIKAMGWTPEEAVEKIAVIAAGEVGRKKKALPATTLQALMAPQLTKIEEYGITEEAAQDPRKLLEQLRKKQADMDRQAFTRMLVDIYGTEAAAGVSKLITTPSRGIQEVLRQAAGEAGAEAERAEEKANRETLERRDAATKARARDIKLQRKLDEQYMEDVREIGREAQKELRIKEPKRQRLREALTIGEAAEEEQAAFREWEKQLGKEGRKRIERETGLFLPDVWRQMSAKQKWEALQRTGYESEETTEQPIVPETKYEKPFIQKTGEGLKNIFYPFGEKPPPAEEKTAGLPVSKEVEVPLEPVAKETTVEVPVTAAARQVEVPVEEKPQSGKKPVSQESIAYQSELEIDNKKYIAKLRKQREYAIGIAQQEWFFVKEWEEKLNDAKKGTERYERLIGLIEEHKKEALKWEDQAKWFEEQIKTFTPYAYPTPKKPAIKAEEEQKQIQDHVEAEAEPEAVPFIAPSAQPQKKIIHQTVNHFNYIYDHSMRFHPRVGDDESGPRIAPGVQV